MRLETVPNRLTMWVMREADVIGEPARGESVSTARAYVHGVPDARRLGEETRETRVITRGKPTSVRIFEYLDGQLYKQKLDFPAIPRFHHASSTRKEHKDHHHIQTGYKVFYCQACRGGDNSRTRNNRTGCASNWSKSTETSCDDSQTNNQQWSSQK